MSELAAGVRDFGRGLAFLNAHPRLWGWVIAPALVSLLLLIALIVAVARLVSPIVDAVASRVPSWLEGVASWGLGILVVVALAAGAALIFVALVGVIAGPFCELLSEAVEARLTGRPSPPFSLRGFLAGAVLGIGHGLRRLIAAVIAAVLLFALSLIPIIGTLTALTVGAWLSARAAAYDAYDSVLSRRELAYRDKLAFLDRHRSRTLGLGAAVAGLLLVPVANLVALGIGAAGATIAAQDLAPR